MEYSELQAIIANVLNIDPGTINKDTRFIKDLRIDSLDIYSIFIEIEKECQVSLDDVDPKNIITVGDVYNYINNQKG